MVYTRQHFEHAISSLCPEGFHKEPDISIFTSASADVERSIHVSYNDYSPHCILVRGVAVHLSFKSIERMMASVLREHGANSGCTIQKVLQRESNIDYAVFENDITDQSSFNIVAAELRKLINGPALDFFEEFSSIDKLASFLASKKPEEIASVMPGAILFPKTVLILREARHPDYLKRLHEFHSRLTQLGESKPIYKSMSLVFNQLFARDLNNASSR